MKFCIIHSYHDLSGIIAVYGPYESGQDAEHAIDEMLSRLRLESGDMKVHEMIKVEIS